MITNDGFLVLSSQYVIGPGLREAAFLESILGGDAQFRGSNDGWSRYKGRGLLDNGLECHFTTYFYASILKKVTWRIKWPGVPTGWRNWDERQELKVKELNDEVLIQWLGPPPYSYSWGEITSYYDPRSGSSGVLIKYN